MTAGIKLNKKKVEEALRETHGNFQLAGRKLNCTRQAIHRYVDKYPDLQVIVQEERDAVIDVAESALQRAVLNGEPWAIALTLKTIGKKRGYVEKTEQEYSGPDGKPILPGIFVFPDLAMIHSK